MLKNILFCLWMHGCQPLKNIFTASRHPFYGKDKFFYEHTMYNNELEQSSPVRQHKINVHCRLQYWWSMDQLQTVESPNGEHLCSYMCDDSVTAISSFPDSLLLHKLNIKTWLLPDICWFIICQGNSAQNLQTLKALLQTLQTCLNSHCFYGLSINI